MNTTLPNPIYADVANFILEKLLEQGGPSVNFGTGECQYRGSNNRKCAVGWLIPDKKYSLDMEGSSVFTQMISGSLPKKYRKMTDFLYELQKIHDNALYWSYNGPLGTDAVETWNVEKLKAAFKEISNG